MRGLAVRGTLGLRSSRTPTPRSTCHTLVRRGLERVMRHGTVDASRDNECFTAGVSTASWTPSYDSFESAVRHSSISSVRFVRRYLVPSGSSVRRPARVQWHPHPRAAGAFHATSRLPRDGPHARSHCRGRSRAPQLQ
jgi:hypothetical protein